MALKVQPTQSNPGVIANTVDYVRNNKMKSLAIVAGTVAVTTMAVIGVRAGMNVFSTYMAPEGCTAGMWRDPSNEVRTFKAFFCAAPKPTLTEAFANSAKADLNTIVTTAQAGASAVASTASAIASKVASAASSFSAAVGRSFRAFSDVSYDPSCQFVNETSSTTNPFMRNVHFTCPKA